MKRFFASLLVAVMMVSAFGTTALAASDTSSNYSEVQQELTMRVVSQDEMDSIIANIQAGMMPLNWFDDIVLVSGKRVAKADGTEYFSLTLLNSGFVFDRVDVDGNIVLYDMNLRVVANKTIDEDKLVYGFSRKIDIYPLGGHYATGNYTLRVSDGDAGTTYTGTVAELGG